MVFAHLAYLKHLFRNKCFCLLGALQECCPTEALVPALINIEENATL